MTLLPAAHILEQRRFDDEKGKLRLSHRHLCVGPGTGNSDRSDFSRGLSAVSGGFLADRLRDHMSW